MSRVSPYHTTHDENYPPTHRDVYHDRDDCHYGNEIELEHREEGRGARPRCARCLELSRILPFHTSSDEYPPWHRDVYHDHADCHYAQDIKPSHRVAGTGGRPLCSRCAEESRVFPYHTTNAEYAPSHRDVYHDHDNCAYAMEIKAEHRQDGIGGRPRCSRCVALG